MLAAVAVCTLALNLRTAAVSLSPLVAWIEADIPLPPSVLGLLGMAPPIVFAFAGLALGRWIAPRGAGLAVLSLATVAVGSLMRAFATDIALIAGGGVIALLGMGIGNVLIPGLVRRYLPDRIGLVTALYTAMLAVSAVLPPFVEPSVAQTSSWRVAIGLWALLPIVGAVPMALLALRMRAREAARFGVAPGRSRAARHPPPRREQRRGLCERRGARVARPSSCRSSSAPRRSPRTPRSRGCP